jgi:putative oligomerization/nucleic acid binding protein/phospholipase D-like protein
MNYPLLNVFLTTMWVFLWILWIMLLFRIFGDIFRDRELGGWAKAGWSVFVIVLPFLGVFVYLIARGRGMAERAAARQVQAEQDFRSYVRDAASEQTTTDRAEQLRKLAELKNHGDITDDEYQRAKESVLV